MNLKYLLEMASGRGRSAEALVLEFLIRNHAYFGSSSVKKDENLKYIKPLGKEHLFKIESDNSVDFTVPNRQSLIMKYSKVYSTRKVQGLNKELKYEKRYIDLENYTHGTRPGIDIKIKVKPSKEFYGYGSGTKIGLDVDKINKKDHKTHLSLSSIENVDEKLLEFLQLFAVGKEPSQGHEKRNKSFTELLNKNNNKGIILKAAGIISGAEEVVLFAEVNDENYNRSFIDFRNRDNTILFLDHGKFIADTRGTINFEYNGKMILEITPILRHWEWAGRGEGLEKNIKKDFITHGTKNKFRWNTSNNKMVKIEDKEITEQIAKEPLQNPRRLKAKILREIRPSLLNNKLKDSEDCIIIPAGTILLSF